MDRNRETGTASVNTMGSGHLSGPALHNGWQHSINAGPGRQPRLVASWSVPFGARPPPAGERGPGWDKNRPCRRPIPLPPPPKTSHDNSKSLTRTPLTRSPCPHHRTRSTPCYSGPVRAPAFRERQTGAARPGYKVLPMASVGEPINRPRHTGQRDRSQTVLAAPRDTKGAAPHQAAPGAPLAGRPGVGNCLWRIGEKRGLCRQFAGRHTFETKDSA